MGAPLFEAIAAQDVTVQAALRDLNNANARETSFLTEADWAVLVAEAFAAICVADAGALLITFDQNAAYHSLNYRWFQSRHDRFVYVDRIIVAESRRGEGWPVFCTTNCSTGRRPRGMTVSSARSISNRPTRVPMRFTPRWASPRSVARSWSRAANGFGTTKNFCSY